MIKSTQAVPWQICKTFSLNRALPSLSRVVRNSHSVNSEYTHLLETLTKHNSNVRHARNVRDITLLSCSKMRLLRGDHYIVVHTVSNTIPRNIPVQYYKRIVV